MLPPVLYSTFGWFPRIQWELVRLDVEVTPLGMMLFTSAFILSVLASSVLAAQTNACENYGKTNVVPLRIDPTIEKATLTTQQTCLNVHTNAGVVKAPYYTYFTDGAKTAELTYTDQKYPADVATCEHIVEVQLLKQVLDTGGPCSVLANEKDDTKRKAIRANFRKITDILNGTKNLVFFTTKIEKQKGDMANKAQAKVPKPYRDNPKDPHLRNRLEAIDHFVNSQTVDDSKGVAAALDAKIAELFPGTTETVVPRWTTIRTYAHTCYQGMTPTPLEKAASYDEHSCFENILVEQL